MLLNTSYFKVLASAVSVNRFIRQCTGVPHLCE